MHIPDNYLSPATCAAAAAVMVPVWALAARKVGDELSRVEVPMLGIGAAFAFLLMMFNIPLPGGTTGHAVGGTLVAVLLGPWSACIALTTALFLQALLFGDGGILAFGANCLNMAFVLPFVGYFTFRVLRGWLPGPRGESVALGIGAWAGINVAALVTAVEFGIQPLFWVSATGQPLYSPYPLSVALPAMLVPHLTVAGFVEAAFTVSIYLFVKKVSPGTLYQGSPRRTPAIGALVLGLVALSPLGLLAVGTAWGEWGADEIAGVVQEGRALGFVPEGMAQGFQFSAPLADYALPGLPDPAAYLLSALAGVAALVIAFKLLGLLKKRRA